MEKDYADIYIEPVPSFYAEFIEFIKSNFFPMELKDYQAFVEKLYEKYSRKNRIDFVLADIYESCVRISQIYPYHRREETIIRESENISIHQKVWLDVVLKDLRKSRIEKIEKDAEGEL